MDRRDFLKISGLTAVVPSFFVNPPKNKWFTHEQLMYIYNEVIVRKKPWDIKMYKDSSLPEAFYLCVHMASNYTHRRTYDLQSKRWIVVSPSICDRGLFYDHQFREYWGPPGNFTQRDWKWFIQDEVSPGVFLVGVMNSAWSIYVDERFPEGVALQGLGYKEVHRYKYDKQLEELTFKLGPPTTDYYWPIKC